MSGIITKKKLVIEIIIATAVLVGVMIFCSLIGTQDISLRQVFSGPGESGGNLDYTIFMNVRVPRIILAAIVGAALACAGVVLQGLLRNPLADPYILGISSGAGLGAIIAILSGVAWSLWGRSAVEVCAFAGALGTVWLVWTIGHFAGKSQITSLLLAGVVVNALFSAVIMFLISMAKSVQIDSTIFWLMGHMKEEDYFVLWVGASFVAAGIIVLFGLCPQLNVLSFGEDQARTSGINTARVKLIAFAVAAFITATAVSLSGLIGFVGLIVPHAVRLMFGPDHRRLLPLSAIVGAIFLVAADTIARTIVAPAILPVGVVTAMVGGPFFLILLVKYARKVGWELPGVSR